MSVSVETSQNKPKKSARKALYALHTWVGFHLAVIMFVVLATGTFATIANELDWLANPDTRVSPDGSRVSWQEMVNAVQAYDPKATLKGLEIKREDYFAARASVLDEEGYVKITYVNQWTGEVLGSSSRFNFQFFFRNLHRYLFLPKAIGLTLVSSMAIVLAISLYTGLKTSRNWGTLMTRIRLSKGARIAVGDAHKFAGLWSIWFFILMISTGIWYYAEFLGKDFEPSYLQLSKERRAELGDVLTLPKAEDVIAAAQAAYPEMRITSMGFADITRAPITVDGSVGNPIVRPRANRVYLDPVTLEVLHVQRDKDLPAIQWINQIVDPLHFGSFGGLAVKLIWFVFGLFLTGLSASGVWLTWKRLKSRGATRTQIATLPILLVSVALAAGNFLFLKSPLGAVSVSAKNIWFIVAVAIGTLVPFALASFLKHVRSSTSSRLKTLAAGFSLLATTGGFTHGVILQQPMKRTAEMSLGDVGEGVFKTALFAGLSETGGFSGDLRLAASGVNPANMPHLKSVSVQLHDAQGPLGVPKQKKMRDILVTHNVRLTLPKAAMAKASHVSATFALHSGQTFTGEWRFRDQSL